jgi:hypothetical protein
MTKLMEQAIDALRALPNDQQEEFARFVLHELAEDREWMKSSERHSDAVNRLVADVLSGHQQSRRGGAG